MKKLLVIDDEEAMRRLYRIRLSEFYEVFETGDPEQALALALEHKPDAVLLDLKMPKYDGFELCQNFRNLGPTSEVPLFVITGQAGNYQKECEAMGAFGYFIKPIDFKLLKETLNTAFLSHPVKRPGHRELPMRVMLRLKGVDTCDEPFNVFVETESVRADGFSCTSSRTFDSESTLEVYLGGRMAEVLVGIVRLEHRAPAGLERHRYRFEFEGEKSNWIFQDQHGIARATGSLSS